jgi:hypothetical protein
VLWLSALALLFLLLVAVRRVRWPAAPPGDREIIDKIESLRRLQLSTQ